MCRLLRLQVINLEIEPSSVKSTDSVNLFLVSSIRLAMSHSLFKLTFFSEGRAPGDCIACFLLECGFPAFGCLGAGAAYLGCLTAACGGGILATVCLADCFLPL